MGRPTPDTSAFIDGFRVARDTFAVAPGGGGSACYEVFSPRDPHADTFFYGNVSEEGFHADPQKLDHLRRQTVDARAYCESCFAKWHCSGDCYHKVLLAGGEEFGGTERCHITRGLLKDAIVDRIAAAGGLVWRGDSPNAR